MNINIKKLSDDTILPTKAHSTDACFDIYANLKGHSFLDFDLDNPSTDLILYEDAVKIRPGESVTIPTGFCTEIPEGYFAPVFCRSGMGIKRHLRLSNSVGIIDSSYRGEWMVALHNDGNKTQVIKHGDRIAQFTILPVLDVNLKIVYEVSDTDRGTGGFGSSGT